MIDFKLSDSVDIQFDSSGDFKTTDKYNTAIVTALHTDRDKNYLIDNEEEGSYLYHHYQARVTSNRLIEVENDVIEALEFIGDIEESAIINVDTDIEGNKIIYSPTIETNRGLIYKGNYEL